MKKKIRKFFETLIITAIVIAFVTPVVGTLTKPTLSEEILEILDKLYVRYKRTSEVGR